jgi:hypothetical protein
VLAAQRGQPLEVLLEQGNALGGSLGDGDAPSLLLVADARADARSPGFPVGWSGGGCMPRIV